MSLVDFAIRTCLKRALLNRTLAEDRVNDSMITPIPELVGEAAKPLIIVSTDDDETVMTSFSLVPESRSLDVIIEVVLAGVVSVDADTVALDIPHTDAGMEASLDFLQRGILRALADPDNAWAELFRLLAGTPSKLLKRRGADTRNGVRFAARQLVLTCDPACEPDYGQPPAPGGGFDRLIAQLRGDEEMADYADVLLKQIVGDALPSWRSLQASLGLCDDSIRALGVTPFDPEEAGEPPVLTATTAIAETLNDGTPIDQSTGTQTTVSPSLGPVE